MGTNIKSNCVRRANCNKSFFTSLVFILLISSLFIGTFTGCAMGQGDIHVSTETELKNAINNAADDASVTIAFDKHIALTATLEIPANKDITLKSNSNSELFKLFGVSGQTIISVRGKLTLTNIIVTRVERASGIGVSVDGTFIMTGGEISANIGSGVSNNGNFTMSGGKVANNGDSGVRNNGNFIMTGGEISGNTAPTGGGVLINSGQKAFTMSGGKISNNAAGMGGGVYNGGGTFTMSGGTISDNVANGNSPIGGGVDSHGAFIMSGGEIFGNTAGGGGGVSCNKFTMQGGKISDNTANIGGGVRIFGSFDMTDGTIAGNTATDKGGGVYISGNLNMAGGTISGNKANIGGGVCNDGTFTMSNGAISSNTAENQGGGVYHGGDVFELLGGKITGNTAVNSGGGIWVAVANLGKLFVYDGVIFADNRASVAYNRDVSHNDIYNAYIGGRVTWTSPCTQGYNNYDISYTSGTIIPDTEWQQSAPNNDKLSNGNDGSRGSDNNGQNTNDNEPPFNCWNCCTVIIMVGFFILIIAVFARADRRKMAGIDPNNIEKNQRGFRYLFLVLISACYYNFYVAGKEVAKLNVMSKCAPNGEIEKINYSAKFAAILWTLLGSPIIFIFVNGFLLNPTAYTALFNLDYRTAFSLMVDKGTNTLGTMLNGLLGTWDATGLFGVIVWLILALIAIGYLYSKISDTKDRLRQLAVQYIDNYYTDGRWCYDVLNAYEDNDDRKTIIEAFIKADNVGRLNDKAFEVLRCIHNATAPHRFDEY